MEISEKIMEKVHLKLTLPQAKKLMKGGTIQLSPNAVRDDSHYLILSKKTANKVRRAHKAGTGCRINLSQEEMHHSGKGIGDFFKNAFNKIKEGADWVKTKIIDTPEYQQYIKPIVRQGVDTGMQLLSPRLGTAGPTANAAVNKFGELSGAYGIREEFMKAKDFYNKHAKKYVAPHLRKVAQSAERALVSKAKQYAPQYATDIDKLHDEYGERAVTEFGNRTGAFGLRKGRGLQNDYSNFLGPSHPAMRPLAPNLPPMGGWIYMYPVNYSPSNRGSQMAIAKGGSFKPAGSGKRGFGPRHGGSFMTN